MIKKYSTRATLSATVAGLSFCLIGFSLAVYSSNESLSIICLSIGAITFNISYHYGFWSFAKARGRSGWLGIFLVYLSLLGIIILLCLKDKSDENISSLILPKRHMN